MLPISGRVMVISEVFIKSHLIVVDKKDDRLYWYSFLALFSYSKSKSYLACRTQHNIYYHMTLADKKRAAAVLNEFQGIKQYHMREFALRRHLNINIFDFNERYQRYDVIETWFGDSANTEYDNALIYSDKHVHPTRVC